MKEQYDEMQLQWRQKIALQTLLLTLLLIFVNGVAKTFYLAGNSRLWHCLCFWGYHHNTVGPFQYFFNCGKWRAFGKSRVSYPCFDLSLYFDCDWNTGMEKVQGK